MSYALSPSLLNPVMKGLLSWLPGTSRAFLNATSGGATGSALYCYGVWLKHLCLCWGHGMREMPHTVVEIGPGTSLGTGLAALLCGAERYVGIDSVRHASASTCRAVLHELISLLRSRAPRPGKGWPDYEELLDARLFPAAVLDEQRLAHAMRPERLRWIERAVERLDSSEQDPCLRYVTWDERVPLGPAEADFIFSHVVLNMVERVERLYSRLADWLAPGGWTSHQIDFTSLGLTREWNGHLQFGEALWRLVAGRRPLIARRERLSKHLGLLQASGLGTVAAIRALRYDGIPRQRLASSFRDLSDEDLACFTAFLVARKPA